MNYALKEMSQQDLRFLLLKLSGSNLYCQQLSQEKFVKVEEFHKLIYISQTFNLSQGMQASFPETCISRKKK